MPVKLNPNDALLMVVDLQERLLPSIHDREEIVRRAVVMIRAARILELPIIWTQQYRKGLGSTEAAIVEAIGDAAEPIEKLAFGCLGDEDVAAAVKALGRSQLILCGIEAHVCILQTALRGIELGWEVFLAEDAIGSRRPSDRETGLRRLMQAGAIPATVEMLIMEALGVAGGGGFKAILPLLKEK